MQAGWNLLGAWGVVTLFDRAGGGHRVGDTGIRARVGSALPGRGFREIFSVSYPRLVVQLYGVTGDAAEAEDLAVHDRAPATGLGRERRRPSGRALGLLIPHAGGIAGNRPRPHWTA